MNNENLIIKGEAPYEMIWQKYGDVLSTDSSLHIGARCQDSKLSNLLLVYTLSLPN
jgi:hypothetical protein